MRDDGKFITLRSDSRKKLVVALKEINPGAIRWIKRGSTVLDRGKWSILAEARDLRLSIRTLTT
jgi:hypothetical protein